MDRKRHFVSAPQRAHERSYSTHTRLYWQERVRLRQDSLLDHIPAAIPETAVRHAKTPLLGRNAPLVSRLLPGRHDPKSLIRSCGGAPPANRQFAGAELWLTRQICGLI